MVIKAVGAVLVLVSAFSIGSLMAFRVKEQEKWLRDMKMALFLLEGELEYHQMPFPEAVQMVAGRHGGRLDAFLAGLGEKLQKRDGSGLKDLWRQQAELSLEECPLGKGQKEEFAELGLFFSEADSNVRRHALEFYLARLEEEIVQCRKTGDNKAYLYRTMGMLGGIFLLILAM